MQSRLEPVFLDGFPGGRRFALWVNPPAGARPRGSVLCVQPFGEEANLARRVLVEEAARLARAGWTTLVFDPFGTGDSDGASSDATLSLWRTDLLHASHLLRERVPGPFVLWGTRMGALLAADLSIALDQLASAMVFWQPASTGAHFVDPLLKLASVGAMARKAAVGAGVASASPGPEATGFARAGSPVADGAGAKDPVIASDTEASNREWTTPSLVDVAGYRLRRDLLGELSALTMQPPAHGERGAPCPALVLGVQRVLPAGAPAPKPLARIAEQWLGEGYLTRLRVVQGEPFWASLEPSTPLAAFDATEAFLETLDGAD